MKNYLFAPFEDDDEKIEDFNAVVNALKYVLADVCPTLADVDRTHNMESAIHGLRVFIGRLESYYDVIISKLQAELETAQDGIDDLNDVLRDMQEESKEQIKENKRLKVETNVMDEISVKNSLINHLERENKELKAEIKEKEEQYHMLASSKDSNSMKYSSLKEYKAEADEYFHHNPQSKGIRFHMIDFNDYDYDDDNEGCNGGSGEYNGTLYAEDCLIEIDNNERSN